MQKQAGIPASVNTHWLPWHKALKQAEEEYAAAYWATEVWRDAAVTMRGVAQFKALAELLDWIHAARDARDRLERLQRMKRGNLGPTAGVP